MIRIRNITENDCETIVEMIRELASFESLEDQVTATAEDLRRIVFDEELAHCFICDVNGKAAGYCMYYFNISTFKCKKGVYIEDIYVRSEFRGQGLGKAMIQNLALLADEWGCGRLEWMCLDWNTNAQEFYTSLGGKKAKGWELFRVDEKALPGVYTGCCNCHKGHNA